MPQGVKSLGIDHLAVQSLPGPVMNMAGVGGSASFRLTSAQIYLVDSGGQGVTDPFAVQVALAGSPSFPDEGHSAILALLGRDILNKCDCGFYFRSRTVVIDQP